MLTATRVLIVEDKMVVANNLQDRLQAIGYSVLGIVPSGEEAIRLVTELRPDIVLMDIRLPGELDGIQAAQEIRAGCDIPIVYLTGHADEPTLQRAWLTEPYGYLLKPFDMLGLRSTIEMALYRHAAERRVRDSEEEYRTLVECSLQGILIAQDLPPRLVFANHPLAEISGYDLEELLSLPPEKVVGLIHPQDRATILERLEAILSGRSVVDSDEFRVVRKDGSLRWLQYYASLIEREGQPAVQAAIVDITERKEAEAALLEAHDELERRVAARTADLARANLQLQQEIAERRQAQEALQRRADELRVLNRFGQEVSASLSLDQVTRAALQGIFRCVSPDLAMLFMRRGDELILQAVYPEHSAFEQQAPEIRRVGECLCGLTVSEKRAIYSQDIRNDPRCTLHACKSVGMHSFAALPLLKGEEVLGVLGAASRGRQDFGERSAFLEVLAADVATGLQNAFLHQQVQHHAAELEQEVGQRQHAEEALRRRNRELALLNRVISATATSQDVNSILQAVCKELAGALDLSHAAAALTDERTAQATVVAEFSTDSVQPRFLGRTIAVKDNPALIQILQQETPLRVDLARNDPQLSAIQEQMCGSRHTSLLILPLCTEGALAGGLGLCARESRPFSEEEIDLAQRVAEQVSGSLARVRLAETQHRLSTAVEQTADAILILDDENSILYVNPAFERATGYTRTEALGQTPRLFKSRWHEEAFYQTLRETIAAGQVWKGRLINKRKDGALFPTDATITPLRNPAGEIANVIATLRDATREAQLEEQVRHAQKMEAVGQLAGGIAHDFNNLLTVIHMSSIMLQRQMHPEDPLLEHVKQIQGTTRRAANLTGQLLSFSRREFGTQQVLDLNQIINDLDWMLQRLVGNDIQVVKSLARDLRPVEAAPSQLEQLLVNLVVNARDAMPKGGTLTIRTANVVLDEAYAAEHLDARPGAHTVLTISDTGVGMDDEVKARIFEPFFTTKKRGEGTGLGLTTVFGIVKQSGGHIVVDSSVGQGTTFRIFLPSGNGVARPAETGPSIVSDIASVGQAILVVEDEELVRDLAARVLRAQGYQVHVAGSGPEALQLGEQCSDDVHLLLVDLKMPGMNGLEVAHRLRSRWPQMRVLYMSGYSTDVGLVRQVLDEGMPFLPKPFDLDALMEKVQTALDDE